MSCSSNPRTRSCTTSRRDRALVEPAFLPSIFLPYDRLLARGRVEHDRAIAVGPHRVVLASGKAIAADYVVLATGSTYPFPAKVDDDATAAALDRYRAAYDELVPAGHALLIGAGAVGIELAGEIKSKWPDKAVTLLDVADDVLGEFTVTTNDDQPITADIWFRCFGVLPVSDYLDAELAPARRADGFVTVGPALQVAGYGNVFAIGDVSTADAKMAGRAGRQGHLVAENIRKLMSGAGDLTPYEPIEPAIIVPIGPEGGSGQSPGQDGLAPREMVSQAKGRDLMVGRYSEIFGVTNPEQPDGSS
jgi:NADH dehydrogenase FAD-containing subunit